MRLSKRIICGLLLCGSVACGKNPDLGGGFKLVDGGGSKISLTKDGRVVISHTVSGVGSFNGGTVIEDHPYDSATCIYYWLDATHRKMTRISNDASNIQAAAAIRSVEGTNSRSCRKN